MSDAASMERAIALAMRAERSAIRPNPPVGCLLVSDEGEVVGEGWHARCGEEHAEAIALAAAGERARGATAYVTLEPCASHGRTPPCADALIAAGVRRVVYGAGDPSQAGLARLRDAGVSVDGPVCEEACRALVAPFLTHAQGRPYVILKWAASLDGKLATRTGESRWISGPAARALVHRLRASVDAVAVGRGTAEADDPRLTARDVGAVRQPTRVLVDSHARLDSSAQLLSEDDAPTLVAHLQSASPSYAAHVDSLPLPGEDSVDLAALMQALAQREIQVLLVEGGARLAGSLVAAGLVDVVLAFAAPLLIGGVDAPGALAGPGVAALGDAPRWELRRVGQVGQDAVLLASSTPPWCRLDALVEAALGAV